MGEDYHRPALMACERTIPWVRSAIIEGKLSMADEFPKVRPNADMIARGGRNVEHAEDFKRL